MSKRLFDIVFALFILFLFFWVLILSWVIAIFDTKSNGIFAQERIGQYGKPFVIYKFRTIRDSVSLENKSISRAGSFLRNYKLDELPQLFNILKGQMSFVGPRPDIAGYYDLLEGEDKKILELKPGLTCPATLKYYNEEHVLETIDTPLLYNDTVIFPDKIKMNLAYYQNSNLGNDMRIIFKTIGILFFKRE